MINMPKINKKSIGERLKDIRLIVSDVDGVLTTGAISFDSSGKEIKTFHVKDSFRITIWLRSGNRMLWFTGRKSPGVVVRAKEVEVDLVFKQAIHDGLFAYVKEKYGVDKQQVLYVGDDWSDLYYMSNFGVSVAPQNATEENKKVADIITKTRGGEGVLSEIVETVMRAQGTWQKHVDQYLKKFIL